MVLFHRHLDISGTLEDNGRYHRNPEEEMAYLAENLPNLTSLDISATNLASYGTKEHTR